MRRITLWITATLAVTALLFAYQLNVSGGGKAGENHSDPAVTAPAASGPEAAHTGKPGEHK